MEEFGMMSGMRVEAKSNAGIAWGTVIETGVRGDKSDINALATKKIIETQDITIQSLRALGGTPHSSKKDLMMGTQQEPQPVPGNKLTFNHLYHLPYSLVNN